MYRQILVPLDGSPTSDRGLREAIALAADQDAQLVLLHVVDDYPMIAEVASATAFNDIRDSLLKYGHDVLAKARASATEAGVPTKTIVREVTEMRVADAVIDEAGKNACDLIVMGTHGRRGVSRLAMGSDAELVVRMSPVPVLLVRGEQPDS